MTEEELLPFCECGCGERVTKLGNRFIHGHHIRGENNPMKNPDIAKKMSVATLGIPKPHTSPAQIAADKAESKRRRGVLLPREVGIKISAVKREVPHTSSKAHLVADEAKRGVPLSPEHIAAMSESSLNSDAVKANADRMRGGNDLVDHHYIYDHSDLSKYTMKVTRSKHAQIHAWTRKAGIVVPHINEDADE